MARLPLVVLCGILIMSKSLVNCAEERSLIAVFVCGARVHSNSGEPSFSDWIPFGGWAIPSVKQFTGTQDACGVGIDKDWYP